MSRITRRKHVLKEMMEDNYEFPKKNQQIVRVVRSRGNNLHEVEAANEEEHFLVTMPKKFRHNIYVKRGDYILVEAIEEGAKVKAEIYKLLTPEHIKEYTKANVWPERFAIKTNRYIEDEVFNKYAANVSEDDDLEPNMNRLTLSNIDDNDQDEGEEDYDDDDDDDSDESCSSED